MGELNSDAAALKIRAQTQEDIETFSAFLQDAILAPEDVTMVDGEAVLIVNRFCWEQLSDPPKPPYHRTHAALRIATVNGLQTRGLDLKARGAYYVLLSITLLEDGETLRCNFSGDCELMLKLQPNWSATLTDLGASWPTESCPNHEPAKE